MSLSDIKVTSDGVVTKIFINGKELYGVKNLSICHDSVENDRLMVCTVSFFVDSLELDGMAEVQLINKYQNVIKKGV